jgi:hypothetical protein
MTQRKGKIKGCKNEKKNEKKNTGKNINQKRRRIGEWNTELLGF